MATLFTATGSKIYIAPSVASEPANAAAYAALTWTEITGVNTFGDYGDSANIVSGAVVGDGRVRKAKAARDSGTFDLTMYPDGADAGQAALIAAELTNNNYPFKILLPNRLTGGGTDELNYFIGIVSGGRKTIGANDALVTVRFTVACNSKITITAAT
jgi:hypothetical protein